MAQISYTNKVALNENPEIANINKVTDDDMNEIKQVVNDNYNNTIVISDTQPTSEDNKIWIDTGEVQNLGSEVHIGDTIDSKIGLNILYSRNLFNENTYTNGLAWNNATGFPSRATAYLSITSGKTYTISVSNINKLTGSPQIYIAEKVSTEASNHTGTTLSITANGNYQFTTTSSGKVLAIQLTMASGNISSSNYPDIMIVEGSTPKPYAKYVSQPSINVYGEDIYVKGQNDFYSTQEQRIGTWVNGKPLYRKVIEFGQLPSGTRTSIAHNISNLEHFTKIEGISWIPGTELNTLPIPATATDSINYQVYLSADRTNVNISTNSNRTAFTRTYITLEYTKTTD